MAWTRPWIVDQWSPVDERASWSLGQSGRLSQLQHHRRTRDSIERPSGSTFRLNKPQMHMIRDRNEAAKSSPVPV